MTAATPTPTPCPVLWRDTQAGRAEEYVRQYVPGFQLKEDFHGAVEALGIKKAAQMMREVEESGQNCPNMAR